MKEGSGRCQVFLVSVEIRRGVQWNREGNGYVSERQLVGLGEAMR